MGKAVAHVATSTLPLDSRLLACAAFCAGMALFTVVMAAIGMFSAYCGTLMTPMAANFNIVPAALLQLPDKNAVIKAQLPTALPLLGANIVLLYFLMYR